MTRIDRYPVDIPPDLQRLQHCEFESRGTTYLIEIQESDISRLCWTDRGTCFDPNLAPTFELRVYEYDAKNGYRGLSGQFSRAEEIDAFYGIETAQIQRSLN